MFDLASKYILYLDKDKDKNLKFCFLLLTLERYVNGAIIEMNRIERMRKRIYKEFNKLTDRENYNKYIRKRDFRINYLACDTHFYFICIDKIYKLIGKFGKELDNINIKILKTRINKIFDIQLVRGHLEHIENRCMGYLSKRKKIQTNIYDFGNFTEDSFSFNNKEFPCSRESLEDIKDIYRDLIKIIHDECARNHPLFLERIEQEKRDKMIEKLINKINKESSPP